MTPAERSREQERGYLVGYRQHVNHETINTDECIEVWASASEAWKQGWGKGYEDAAQNRPNHYLDEAI